MSDDDEQSGILGQFQKLENLIIQHTQPPVTGILRNQLSLTREQIEAYQAASDKQDETLAAQAQTIAALQKVNQESGDLDGDTLKLLSLFFKKGHDLTIPAIMMALQFQQSVAEYHLDRLFKKGFAQQTRASFGGGSGAYSLTSSGRAFVMDHKVKADDSVKHQGAMAVLVVRQVHSQIEELESTKDDFKTEDGRAYAALRNVQRTLTDLEASLKDLFKLA